jgi:CheY-like chemotaxis protein
VRKPFTAPELLSAIAAALGPAAGAARNARWQPIVSVGALRVLLAEDEPVNRRVVSRLLEKQGCGVVGAANGLEAVAAFESGRFDVVLMDVQMPGLDGLAAATAIRARERCLDAGMDAYVSKPIDAAELFATIARLTASPVVFEAART